MTAVQFCDDIKEIRNRLHDVSDDIELENEQIMYWLNQRRSTYISSFPHKLLLNDFFYQDMGCVELCRLKQDECDNLTWGNDSLKFGAMPQLIFRPDMDDALRINLVNKVSRIYYTVPTLLQSRLSTTIGRNFNWATIIAGNLYVIPALKQWENFNVINLQVIAAEPEKVLKYNEDGTTREFDFYNDSYPCDPAVLEKIKYDILTKELKISMVMQPDTTNNSRDDL